MENKELTLPYYITFFSFPSTVFHKIFCEKPGKSGKSIKFGTLNKDRGSILSIMPKPRETEAKAGLELPR